MRVALLECRGRRGTGGHEDAEGGSLSMRPHALGEGADASPSHFLLSASRCPVFFCCHFSSSFRVFLYFFSIEEFVPL